MAIAEARKESEVIMQATTEYHAYCITCEKLLDKMNNGSMAEAVARIHIKGNRNHEVVVGLKYYDCNNF